MSVAEALVSYFEDAQLDFHPVTRDGTVYRVPFSGASGTWDVLAEVREDQDQILFYALCPERAEGDSATRVMELLTRLNYGMVLGNFELDLDDGEIRFKTAAVGPEPTPAYLSDVLMANVTVMDACLPAIQSVIAGTRTPLEAMAALEGEAD